MNGANEDGAYVKFHGVRVGINASLHLELSGYSIEGIPADLLSHKSMLRKAITMCLYYGRERERLSESG